MAPFFAPVIPGRAGSSRRPVRGRGPGAEEVVCLALLVWGSRMAAYVVVIPGKGVVE